MEKKTPLLHLSAGDMYQLATWFQDFKSPEKKNTLILYIVWIYMCVSYYICLHIPKPLNVYKHGKFYAFLCL